MYAEAVGAILDRQQYKFAKSMPWLPHWYTLKSTWENPFLYEQVISWILRNGEFRSWGKHRSIRRYFDHGKYRYWPMTTDPKQSILLNRAEIASDSSRPLNRFPAQPYDRIASNYDDIWSAPEALEQDKQIMDMIGYQAGSVLDIGCGTGLFLDHYPDARSYFGCDPSQVMLQRLHDKHPDAITYPLPFEQCLAAISDTKYDYIISLYGSPSYVGPLGLAKIKKILKPSGKLFLMFYSPDYQPITHQLLPDPPTIYQHNFASYGHVSTFGNYTIVQR